MRNKTGSVSYSPTSLGGTYLISAALKSEKEAEDFRSKLGLSAETWTIHPTSGRPTDGDTTYGYYRLQGAVSEEEVAKLAKDHNLRRKNANADLDAAIAELEKVEAEAATTPGFNENPTLVQFVKRDIAERKERIGQERWKRELRREDGYACVITGAKKAIEASHLNFPGERPLSLRGVMLRMDLAHLFDYDGAKLTTREDGTIFWDYPGHELHGTTLNLTPKKAKAVAAELIVHRPQ